MLPLLPSGIHEEVSTPSLFLVFRPGNFRLKDENPFRTSDLSHLLLALSIILWLLRLDSCLQPAWRTQALDHFYSIADITFWHGVGVMHTSLKLLM